MPWPSRINRDSSVFGQDVQLLIIHWLIYTQFKIWIFETGFVCVIFCFNRLMSHLNKYKMHQNSSLAFIICPYTVIKTMFM